MKFFLITFTPLDTLFFREAKPFNAGEGGFLDSFFPPSMQTLSGAIRSAIGETLGVNWRTADGKSANHESYQHLIGNADDPSPLSFSGVYVMKAGNRLYPLPRNIAVKLAINPLPDKKDQEAKVAEAYFLTPSEKAYAMNGRSFPLPIGIPKNSRAKPLENAWVNEENFKQILKGETPTAVLLPHHLFQHEPRVGIGRDNQTSVVKEGLLYFTRHLRLLNGVDLAIQLSTNQAEVINVLPEFNNTILALGGEGRMARITVQENTITPPIGDSGRVIYLLTHGDFAGESTPTDLTPTTACVGKPIREGGWDFAHRRSKPLIALAPAGSAYFLKDNTTRQTLPALLGNRNHFGYGEYALGHLPNQ